MKTKPIVVVGVDDSAHAETALHRAIDEARCRGAALHVVHVEDVAPALLHLPDGVVIDTVELAQAGRRVVWNRFAPILDHVDVDVERVDLDGYPSDAIVEYCQQVDADLLVLGTRGRGRLASTLLGSTSLRALEHAHCDVTIAKPKD